MKRLVAFGLAFVFAAAFFFLRPSWQPLCAAFSPDSVEWILLGCWIDPPSGDPKTY